MRAILISKLLNQKQFMKLNKDSLSELQVLLQQEYGEEVSLAETEKIAQDLLNVFLICEKK